MTEQVSGHPPGIRPGTASSPPGARPSVVLASASAGRLAVLRAAGIDPVVLVSGVDEDAVRARHRGAAPETVIEALAQAKAHAVTRHHSADAALADAIVVGGDSMLLIDGELQGKPHTRGETVRRWETQSGRPGVLLSGLAALRVVDGDITGEASGVASTTVTFSAPTGRELDAYLDSGEPLEVAGAFTIDGLGGWFVDRIEGDPSCVVGVSLPLLRQLLAELGIVVTDLWNMSRLTERKQQKCIPS